MSAIPKQKLFIEKLMEKNKLNFSLDFEKMEYKHCDQLIKGLMRNLHRSYLFTRYLENKQNYDLVRIMEIINQFKL